MNRNHSAKTDLGTNHAANATPAGIVKDAIELGELQCRLLGEDLKQTTRQARLGIVILVAACGCLLAVGPVTLLAIAATLELTLEFSRAASLGLAAAIGLAVSLTSLVIGWSVLRRSTHNLDRSHEELRNNIAWIKQMLTPGN